jgi:predicted nucleic acid-binding Zn ribbon protein
VVFIVRQHGQSSLLAKSQNLHSSVVFPMATYVYETIPRQAGEQPRRFEVVQSMRDAPLQRHPDSGEPVRRVVTGGFGFMGVGEKAPAPAPAAPCSPGCACHSGPRIPSS